MSASLQTRAEIEKLARVLHRSPDDLEALEVCDPRDVRSLRHAVSDALYDADRRHFATVAAVAVKVPIPLAAKLAQHALGAVLAARVTGLIETELAAKLASRLPPDFLADVAVELDPRSANALLSALPADLIAEAAKGLDERGEHVAMSMFVGHLDPNALRATIDVLSDEALLRVGYLIEAPERLDEIYADLTDDRIAGIIALAVAEDRWEELDGIAAQLGPRQRARAEALRAEAA